MFSVDIDYSRSDGYEYVGDERDIRRFINHMISLNPDHLFLVRALDKELAGTSQQYEKYAYAVERIESEFNYTFSDESYFKLPLYILIVNLRVVNGFVLQDSNVEQEVAKLKEYSFIQDNIRWFFDKSVNDEEVMSLTLYLNSLPKSLYQINPQTSHKTDLKHHVSEFIENFEANSAIQLTDKVSLIDRLSVHLAPLMFKQPQVHDYSEERLFIEEKMTHELKRMRHFVETSIHPLEVYFGTKLPITEVYFLCLYLQSNILANHKIEERDVTCLVVCEGGIATSNILRNKLKKIFPSFAFDEAISIREFIKLDNVSEYDLVFSTSYFTSIDKDKLIVISDYENFDEKLVEVEVEILLNQNPNYTKFKVDETAFFTDIEKALGVVLSESDKEALKKSISKHFVKEKVTSAVKTKEQHLVSFLKDSNMSVRNGGKSWEILVKDFLEESDLGYLIDEMLDMFPRPEMKFLFGNQILLLHLHAKVEEDFILKFTHVKEKIDVDGSDVYFIGLLVVSDNYSHLTTLYELHDMSMHMNRLPKEILAGVETKEEMLAIFKEIQRGSEEVND